MPGFFDEQDMNILRGDEKPSRRATAKKSKVLTCADCGLDASCESPKMPVWGKGEKGILLVLDTPSVAEDDKGKPWVGETGRMMRKEIEAATGLDIYRDCYTAYAVRCCARKAVNAISCGACRTYLHDTIRELTPKVIIPFGYWAMIGVSGDILTSKDTGKNSTDWQGEHIPDQRWKIWICPTFELTFVGTGDNLNKPVLMAIQKDVKDAMKLASVPVPIREDDKHVHIIHDEKEAIEFLDNLYYTEGPLVRAFDYETTGRKPHRDCHRIYSVAISDGEESYVFPFFESEEFLKSYKKVMRSSHISWIAHNAKFEWSWTKVKLGYFPFKLEADTMLGAHIENSHKRVGLKPLTYEKFGVAGYEESIEPYLQATKAEEEKYGSNGMNTIFDAPHDDILYYNALDPLYTYNLWEYFKEHLTPDELKAWRFFNDVSVSFVQAECNGLRINPEGSEKTKADITAKMDRLMEQIKILSRAAGWDKDYDFRPSASADIGYFIYNILKIKPEKKTSKGGNAVDKEVMSKVNHPVIDKTLKWKKLQKLRDTYITGILREAVDGFVHPYFNLHTVSTFRTSSSDPNFQNFPKRDKEVSSAIRGLLYPHKGHKLAEYDYKALEVSINACYNKDPNLINYILDPSTDMHRDTGEEIFCYKRGELPKYDRGIAKNSFVFPEFYGSYYKSTALALWEKCSPDTRQHLRDIGLGTYEKFEKHVQGIEKDFWTKRFGVYAKWRDDTYAEYMENGVIRSYLGFQYHAPMTRNEVTNCQAQGGGCHCLIWTFMKVTEQINKRHLKSRIIGQIHDSCVVSVAPDEEELIDYLFWYYGTQAIAEHFKWINVPLKFEKAIGEIDAPWSTIEELGLLDEEVPINKEYVNG